MTSLRSLLKLLVHVLAFCLFMKGLGLAFSLGNTKSDASMMLCFLSIATLGWVYAKFLVWLSGPFWHMILQALFD